MKRLTMLLVCLLASQWVMAQADVLEKTYAFTNQHLDVDIDMGTDFVVKSWSKNEIYVKITYEVNGGKDNEALRIDLDNYDDRLALDIDLRPHKLSESDDCCCQSREGIHWRNNGKNACLEVKVEMMVPSSASMTVETIGSNVTISGIKSDIEVETISGVIDLTWEGNTGAEIGLKSITGDLYTNMDFKTRKDRGLPSLGGRKLKGTYKGGEKEVYLETISGAIYFRKSD